MSKINITLNIKARGEGRLQRSVKVDDAITFGQLAERIEQEVINSTQLDAIEGVTFEEEGYILHRKLAKAGVGDGDTIVANVT